MDRVQFWEKIAFTTVLMSTLVNSTVTTLEPSSVDFNAKSVATVTETKSLHAK